jgi:CRISPR-associated helicase Cas3/CRISPR-associated endonuclease Cas3-HD
VNNIEITSCCLWGKSRQNRQNEYEWHPLVAHMIDTTLVAGEIWENAISPSARKWLSDIFDNGNIPDPQNYMGAFYSLIAGCHDIGKASPAFQEKISYRVDKNKIDIPGCGSPSSNAPHSRVSAATIHPILKECCLDDDLISRIEEIIGSHHGWFISSGYRDDAKKFPSLFGCSNKRNWPEPSCNPWMIARKNLFDILLKVVEEKYKNKSPNFDFKKFKKEVQNVKLDTTRGLVLTGYVILADWLASNEGLFPYLSCKYNDSYIDKSVLHASNALQKVGWRTGWRSSDFSVSSDANAIFNQRFSFSPNGIQQEVIDLVNTIDPRLLLIEAPMGIGKTEAALIAAERLAYKRGIDGVFIGLPTQATSNQMFRRVQKWLNSQAVGTYVVELAHGRALQVQNYNDYVQIGSSTCVGIDQDASAGEPEVLAADEWFVGSKKRLLAPFVVGTIDQVLLSFAKVRYLALRQIGLLGKVVIIDEVHAYDAYMSVFLRRALEWFGKQNVPVILLSATLSSEGRKQLIKSYIGEESDQLYELDRIGYPSITAVHNKNKIITKTIDITGYNDRQVYLEILSEDRESSDNLGSIAETIMKFANQGANVLVVRNTVKRAQDMYKAAFNSIGDKVSLIHARFTVTDRLDKEDKLTSEFGPGGNRPKGHVVIGTQVLEQSLDIDFDVLISDIAPIDLIFQRMGRIHRHKNVRRPDGFKKPRVILTGFSQKDNDPPEFPRDITGVYKEYLLLRTFAVLRNRSSLSVPKDIAELVKSVYEKRTVDVIPNDWCERAEQLRNEWEKDQKNNESSAENYTIPSPKVNSLCDFTKFNIGDIQDDDPRVYAAVRNSKPSIEVALGIADNGNVSSAIFSGVDVPLENDMPNKEQVEAIISSIIRFPSSLTKNIEDTLSVPENWRKHPWLKSQRVVLMNTSGIGKIGEREFSYNSSIGLDVQ